MLFAHIWFCFELLVGCGSEPASLRLTPPYQIKVERCTWALLVGSLNEVYLTRVNTGTEITFQLNCWQGRWFHSADLSSVLTLAFLLLIAFLLIKSRFLDMTTHSHIAFNSKSCCTTIPCVLCCLFEDKCLGQSVHHKGWHLLVVQHIQEITSYWSMETEMPYSASHYHVR